MKKPLDTFAWEQHKLGELGSVTKGAALSKADISETGMPLILYGELYTTYSEVTYNVIRKTEAVVDDKYLSILGDILIPTSGETPEEISRATCVMVPNVILAGDLLVFRPTKEVDGRILSFILNHKLNNKIASIAQGKSIVHIQASELCQLRVTFPTLPEQKKIASLLSSVDETLDLCRRKLYLLTQAKKALMQQIFSRKLRFKTDDDSNFPEWEEKKLGDIGEFIRGLSYDKTLVDDDGQTLVLRSTNILESGSLDYHHDLQFVNKTPSSSQVLKKNDVVICMANGSTHLVGKSAQYDGNSSVITTVGAFCSIFRSELVIAGLLFQTKEYARAINYLVEGGDGALANLKANSLAQIIFHIPTSPEEQQKIASCLSSADALIDQARVELEQWREVKKSLLQQLFV